MDPSVVGGGGGLNENTIGIVEADENVSSSKLGNWCFVVKFEVFKSGGSFNGPLLGGGRCHDWRMCSTCLYMICME